MLRRSIKEMRGWRFGRRQWFVAGLSLLITIGGLSAVVAWPKIVQAINASNETTTIPSALAVGPAILERTAGPGESVRSSVRVSNITKSALPIQSTVRDLIPMEAILPSTDKQLFKASKWFSIEPAGFILQPGETKSVVITAEVPPDASPGGHYATVYFQPLVSTHLITPGTAFLNARVGVLAFLTVKGDIREQASLLNIGGGRIHQSGPVDIVLPIHNTGNVHLLPQGKVTVYDWQGKQVGEVALPNGIVLPGTIRDYHVAWGNRQTLGYFTVRADIVYGAGNVSGMSAVGRVLVVPWLPIALVLVVVILVIIFSARTHSRWGEAWRILRGKHRRYGKVYDRRQQ